MLAVLGRSRRGASAPGADRGRAHAIPPVSKFITRALKAFADHAREKWGATVKVNAIPAGTPVAYGRIVEWKGKPEADIFWGGESALFEKLAEQQLLQKVEISKEAWDSIPASIGKPKPIPLKDKDGFWVGTGAEPYGIVYTQEVQRLGIPSRRWTPSEPKVKSRCPVRADALVLIQRDSSQLSMHGEDKGWEWLKKLAQNTGHFTARSRDVPTVVAKGEYTAGFAVPSYMAFEEKLAGFDLKFVAPKNSFVTPEPMAILAGARNPKAARAFIEFLLSERGQRVFMERGLPDHAEYKVRARPLDGGYGCGFQGGVRSTVDARSRTSARAIAPSSPKRSRQVRSDIERCGRNRESGGPSRPPRLPFSPGATQCNGTYQEGTRPECNSRRMESR